MASLAICPVPIRMTNFYIEAILIAPKMVGRCVTIRLHPFAYRMTLFDTHVLSISLLFPLSLPCSTFVGTSVAVLLLTAARRFFVN